jgi:hypothetical protein
MTSFPVTTDWPPARSTCTGAGPLAISVRDPGELKSECV